MKNPFRSALTLLAGLVSYVAVYVVIHFASASVEARLALAPGRATAAAKIVEASCLALGAVVVVFVLLRLRGQRLGDIGWRSPATPIGWVAAMLLAALYIAGVSFGPLKGSPVFSEWSSYRIALSLLAGVSAGISEEFFFRGFIMTQARGFGAPAPVQIVLSGLCFGVAHIGWGGLHAHLDWHQALGAATATFIVGCLFAGVYLLSKRSLMPVVVAHATIDFFIEPWLVLQALGHGLG